MEEQSFKPGDIVEIQSGGPRMTVQCYDPETGTVRCIWAEKVGSRDTYGFIWSTNKKRWSSYQRGEFAAPLLRKVNVVTLSHGDGRSVFGEALDRATDGRI